MTIKQILGKVSFYLVRFVFFLIRVMPKGMSYAFCNVIAFLGSSLSWKRKNIACKNLQIVFPDKTKKERDKIFHLSLKNMLKNYFEIGIIAGKKYSTTDILNMCNADGLEYLDENMDAGRGILLYSGHFGNFPLMVIWLAQKGYPVAAIYKEAKNFPENYFGNIMKAYKVLPLKYTSDVSLTIAIIKALKQNYIVLIQNDQSVPDGVYINFFNKWVPSAAGPAILAKRTGAPVIPAVIIREKNNHQRIIISPEIGLSPENDSRLFLEKNIQRLADWVAETIKLHPAEWLWLHNRWKREKMGENAG